ncbi:MAG: hypothetical protein M3139_05305 [Bacteroidota bacterium]|nr:hypothetical protein [Bacteroidota bacterium]
MNNFFRAIIAGWGAKKLGGGCLSTIIVFVVIYYALGTCNSHPVQTVPQHNSSIQAQPHKTAKTINLQENLSGQMSKS